MRPRIRTIKPECWQDERVGDLSHGARLLWVGLITMADDEGRLRELPTAINGHIFPHDNIANAKLIRWLAEVEASRMIVRYEVDGKRYIALRNWRRHQRVDRPNPSELPEPPSTNDRRKDGDTFVDECAEKSRPTRTRASGPDPVPDPQVATTEVSEAQAERELFDFWRQRCGHPEAKFTADRRAKVRARLREGYTVAQVRLGIDGAARAAFVNSAGKRFDDIELICRNGSKLEDFIARAALSPSVHASAAAGKPTPSDLLRNLFADTEPATPFVDAEVVEDEAA